MLRAEVEEVGLVITDIRMPGGNGLDFANDLETMRPGTPVSYISGMVESTAVESRVWSARSRNVSIRKIDFGAYWWARAGEFRTNK